MVVKTLLKALQKMKSFDTLEPLCHTEWNMIITTIQENSEASENKESLLVLRSNMKAGVLTNHSRKHLLWDQVPLLSDAELLMSPVIKEDSDCFLTVSFHIRRMRLCRDKQHVKTHQCIHSEHCW